MPTESDAADTSDMEALQGGDDLALNRLMVRHRDKVFHYLIRMLQDESEANDLAQETFVRVYSHRAKFHLKQRFTSWLYTIATNLARDRLKWLARHPNISIDAPFAQSDATLRDTLPEKKPAPDETAQREERVREIKAALAEMPEELRTPLVLAEYENMSQAEIGGILNCTAKAVENRLYRARKLLRERLQHLLAETERRTA